MKKGKTVSVLRIIPLLAMFLISCSGIDRTVTSSWSIAERKGKYLVKTELKPGIRFHTTRFNEAFEYVTDRIGSGGGRLYIHSGVYEVLNPLELKSNLTVIGDGKPTRLIVSDQFSGGRSVIIADSLNDVEVRNLSIRQSNSLPGVNGIEYLHCGTSRIIDVTLIGLNGHGLCLRENSFLCEIRGCTLGGIGKSAVLLQRLGKGRAGDFIPNLVSNCTVYSSGKGIELNSSIVANIVDCQVFQTLSHAYHVHGQSNSVLISGCRSFQIGDVAVKVESSHELNVSSNIFCWSEKEGILLDDVAWGTVTANEFIDNGSFNPMTPENIEFNLDGKQRPFRVRQSPEEIRKAGNFSGIKLQNNCRGVVVSANAIFNWPAAHPMKYGIEEDASCHHNQFVSNNINYCDSGDILSKGSHSVRTNNLSHLPLPHTGDMTTLDPANRLIQGFDLRLMDHYLEQQLKKQIARD